MSWNLPKKSANSTEGGFGTSKKDKKKASKIKEASPPPAPIVEEKAADDDDWTNWGQKTSTKKGKGSKGLVEADVPERVPTPPPAVPEIGDSGGNDDFLGWGTSKKSDKKKKSKTASPEASFHEDSIKPDAIEEPATDICKYLSLALQSNDLRISAMLTIHRGFIEEG